MRSFASYNPLEEYELETSELFAQLLLGECMFHSRCRLHCLGGSRQRYASCGWFVLSSQLLVQPGVVSACMPNFLRRGQQATAASWTLLAVQWEAQHRS